MDFNRRIKFKIGDVPWDMPLGTLLLVVGIGLMLMGLGTFMGYYFGLRLQP
ncbi:hypothetical protein [Nitritalea halalkaliphila]|uniref:hypothetical protein n=1 Tax=Nitritalea halalkaliphila TaxID=590849 RepID=UPI0002E26BE8|nr:hypothetical protein [Nitritalea halalkaliphila]